LFFQRSAGEKGRAVAAAKIIRYATAALPPAHVWKRFLTTPDKHKAARDRRRPLSRAS
jgi:hypothetical protein